MLYRISRALVFTGIVWLTSLGAARAQPQPVEDQTPATAEAAPAAEPASTPAPEAAMTPPPPEPQAEAQSGDTVEESVDFGEEEQKSDQVSAAMRAGAGGETKGDAGSSSGIKLTLDLLLDYKVGQKKFEFRPNHTYVLVQANLSDNLQLLVHVSDNPLFFELTYNVTPEIAVTLGKILIPFGTNEFHHIIGGRVDETSSFLPETWADYGIGIHHMLYDSKYFNVEYNFYIVNGMKGVEAPLIVSGTPDDNNWFKGLGTRWKLTFMNDITATLSAYYDRWDEQVDRSLFFYSVGLEVRPGLYKNVPVLNRLRLRGEWAWGEVQTASDNTQQGLMKYGFARAGYYGELTARILDNLHFRMRLGRINSDNTVANDNDVEVYEPAFLINSGQKVMWVVAYQFTARPMLRYNPENPPDVLYAKVFVRY